MHEITVSCYLLLVIRAPASLADLAGVGSGSQRSQLARLGSAGTCGVFAGTSTASICAAGPPNRVGSFRTA